MVASASAIGLGPAALASALGEPLRLTFPVFVQPGEEVGCVQVRARGDDLPSVFNTRSSVLRSGGTTRIEIRSTQPVHEPAIGIVVSVGCASPISREYVLFLDPPLIPATPVDTESPAVAAPEAPRRAARPAPIRDESTRPTPRPRASSANSATTPTPRIVTPRAPRPVAPVAPVTSEPTTPTAAAQADRTPPPAPVAAPQPVQRQRDRLTVAPSEAGTGAVGSTSPSVPPVMTAPSPAPALASAQPSAGSASTAATTVPPVATLDPNDTAAREEALRKQQADLQEQIRLMSDQIAALRVQAAGLVNRNQALQDSNANANANAGPSPTLIWWLIALAVIAILLAGWMAWRYTQLRRSVEGSAWWTGNTSQAADHDIESGAETRSGGLVALDPGTRLAPKPVTQIDPRQSTVAPPAVTVSNVTESRPTGRTSRFQSAIDTDFTVSDIEAAMATVRTVSPARPPAQPDALDDSDFGALGGPTVPSPFTQPPPPPPAPRPPDDAGRSDFGKFGELDIKPLSPDTPLPPALPASTALPPVRPQAAAPIASPPPPDEMAPLDFKLDIPGYDPLGSDSMKTTMVIDRDLPDEPSGTLPFDLSATPTPIDFELPSTTNVAPLDGPAGDAPNRHGATALDDLFKSIPTSTEPIPELGDEEAFALTPTEVERLTTTAVDGDLSDAERASPRYRLARFADLMNQIDELSESDPLRAIALLRQYVLRDEQIPTLLWLRLFALYKKVDKKSVYDALGEHFTRRYHRPMVAWEQTLGDRIPQTPLSAMTTVDREIEAMWGQEGGLEKIRSLLCDRDQDDAIVFNAVLQRDLLDAAKVFPRADPNASQTGGGIASS